MYQKRTKGIISMVILSCKWKWIMRSVAKGHERMYETRPWGRSLQTPIPI